MTYSGSHFYTYLLFFTSTKRHFKHAFKLRINLTLIFSGKSVVIRPAGKLNGIVSPPLTTGFIFYDDDVPAITSNLKKVTLKLFKTVKLNLFY